MNNAPILPQSAIINIMDTIGDMIPEESRLEFEKCRSLIFLNLNCIDDNVDFFTFSTALEKGWLSERDKEIFAQEILDEMSQISQELGLE